MFLQEGLWYKTKIDSNFNFLGRRMTLGKLLTVSYVKWEK